MSPTTHHYLPPYAPELNASESIWKYLKVDRPGNRVDETVDEVFGSVARVLEVLTLPADIAEEFLSERGTPYTSHEFMKSTIHLQKAIR